MKASLAERLPNAQECDVLVVGGGINGVGIARDLAGRGWRVVLAEQDDLGAHTSSASSKLIHGGLRYLEHFEFGLVRKSLQEREILLKSAPHIIRPLRLVMPHDPSMRPAWMIRLGLFLYDRLARHETLPDSAGIDLRTGPMGLPLQKRFTRGFTYSDGCVDDARLVVLTALDAQHHGAQIHTRTRCVSAQRSAQGWTATLQSADEQQNLVTARLLVNAAGPWAEAFLRRATVAAHGEILASRSLRLVKGSHIIVPRCFEHDQAYLFQNPDRRIIFAIPYEEHFTLIGTTEVDVDAPGDAHVSDDEVAYLCQQVSRYFVRPVTPADVVWAYSGVRPLLDDESGSASAISRDYLLEGNTQAAPLLTVWGGKLTTYRKLAEEAAERIGRLLGESRAPWTERAHLPGGDLHAWIGPLQRPDIDIERFILAARAHYFWLDAALVRRLARAYGSRIDRVLGNSTCQADLGVEVAPGLFAAELFYLRREEWALTAEDVLWRRTKLGLHYSATQRQQVADYMLQITLRAEDGAPAR